MSPDKLIVFDYGGVLELTEGPWYTYNAIFVDACRYATGSTYESYRNIEEHDRYILDRLSKHPYWAGLMDRPHGVNAEELLGACVRDVMSSYRIECETVGYRFAEYVAERGKMMVRNEAMRDLQRYLGAKYDIAVMSNMSWMWLPVFEHLTRDISYKYEWISCKRCCSKPDSKAYNDFMEFVGRGPEGIIFVDDRKENCVAAEAAGWTAIHYEGFGREEACECDIVEFMQS